MPDALVFYRSLWCCKQGFFQFSFQRTNISFTVLIQHAELRQGEVFCFTPNPGLTRLNQQFSQASILALDF